MARILYEKGTGILLDCKKDMDIGKQCDVVVVIKGFRNQKESNLSSLCELC